MIGPNRTWYAVAAVLTLVGSPPAEAQQAGAHAAVRNPEDVQLAATPGFPACVRGAPQSGDPATGPSVLVGEMERDCTIPWHWHSANEHLMMISGEALIEMRDGTSHPLRAGGFALMPAGHIHQFRCTTACRLFVYSDRALDIRYVDAAGNEISLEQALRAAGQADRERE
jgi:quercetin dioxygenase-like cupin family protein